MFTEIAIETHTDCTRDCRWCARHYKGRPSHRMEEDCFKRIVSELGGMRFAGEVSLNLYNEPLLDERLPEWIAELRRACPHAYIYFASNGDLLTRELARELAESGLNSLVVQLYDGKMPEVVKECFDDPSLSRMMGGGIRAEDTLKNARGGVVPYLVTEHWTRGFCPNPFAQLVLDAWGLVWACCNDYDGLNSPGTFPDMSLSELWYSPKMVQLRTELAAGNRNLSICHVCREGGPEK